MPVLPSGQVVSIMSERARFHAMRLRLRITEATPHHELYPLVDILIEQHHGGSGSTIFHFSGYTLGDTRFFNQWEERDRQFFFAWLREPAQVSTIELARRRLLVENGPPKELRHPYPSRLYSLLRKRVEALPLPRAAAVQWKRTLLNLTRNGLRREELEWSGVLTMLSQKAKGEKIDKAQLLEAIDFSHIALKLSNELECNRNCQLPFHEVAQRLAGYQLQLAGYAVADEDLGVVRHSAHHPHYRVGILWPGGHPPADQHQQRWFVFGPYSQPIAHPEERQRLFFASAEEALQAANQHALRNHRLSCDLVQRERYEYMTLHGGEEYREWLVTLPNYRHSLFNGHFYERNILLHIRSKERQTTDGRRVLFIEEIQSDWHQVSERSRLYEEIPLAPFRREWVALALKLMLFHVVERGLDGLAWADGRVHEMRYDRPLAPLRRIYDEEMGRTLERLAKPWQGQLTSGEFATRSPWLHAARHKSQWQVVGGGGRFVTRPRFDKQQALALIERHSKAVTLTLPLFVLPEAMRTHITTHGLPLFGELHE